MGFLPRVAQRRVDCVCVCVCVSEWFFSHFLNMLVLLGGGWVGVASSAPPLFLPTFLESEKKLKNATICEGNDAARAEPLLKSASPFTPLSLTLDFPPEQKRSSFLPVKASLCL